MTVPAIATLPPAPNRGDAAPDFSSKADTFVAALQPLVVQINTSTAWIGTQVTAAEGYKNAAAESAETATEQAAIATGAGDAAAAQVALAVTAANNAAASATAAESAQGSIGNLALMHALLFAM